MAFERWWIEVKNGIRCGAGVVFLVIPLLMMAASAQAQLQTAGQQKCINTFNKSLAKVAQGFAKDARNCVKAGVAAQSCVEAGTKTAKAIAKLPAQVDKKCAETPDFGFTSASAGDVVRDEGLAMIAEIFGPDLDSVVPSNCATVVAKEAGKLLDTQWKSANKAKKKGIKDAVRSSEDLANAVEVGVKTDSKVLQRASKLSQKMSEKCDGITIAEDFPGSCSTKGNVDALASCIDEVVECHFCLGFNRAHGTAIDCDRFDDGVVNDSCAAPPDGKTKGAAAAGITYQCLGFQDDVSNEGSPFSYVTDAVVLEAGSSEIVLEGTASGDLAEKGLVARPFQGAAASIETGPLTLQPFDVCASVAESLLDSVVRGAHQVDPRASGVAEVEFHVRYRAKFELESLVSPADFVAFTETTLDVPGLASASFSVSSDGEVTKVPEGLVVEDHSNGNHHIYEIHGTYVVPGQLSYGPASRNVVTTTLLAGGETAEVTVDGGRAVAGFAEVDAIDSLEYEILSLHPDVIFSFVPEAPASAP